MRSRHADETDGDEAEAAEREVQATSARVSPSARTPPASTTTSARRSAVSPATLRPDHDNLRKRLARGRFAALWDGDDATALSLTRPELELFLQGSQLVGKMPLAPAAMSEKDLVIRA